MTSVRRIIKEEYMAVLKESDDPIYDMYEARDRIKDEMFSDFLYSNNQDFSKSIGWRVVPYPRLKKIWEAYMKMNFVRDVKGLEMIEKIIIRNAIKIDIITELAGHTSWGNADEDFQDNIGYWVNEQMNCILPEEQIDTDQLEIPYDNPEAGHKQKEPLDIEECDTEIHPYAKKIVEEFYNSESMSREDVNGHLFDMMKDKFFDYITDPKSGHLYISDYGLKPIITLTAQLYREDSAEKKVVLMDKILNVVHQRSDMASWFIQGGSSALSDLSGYEIPDEESGGYDTKSAISGRYKMSDY